MGLYNKEWLDSIHQTRQTIEVIPGLLGAVPHRHRLILRRAFLTARDSWEAAVRDGRSPRAYANDISDLFILCEKLSREAERTDVPEAS